MPEMPKVPVYHSQGTPPDTNRLPMADPSIVGGAQILQGAERLQQSLLHLFGVQQHQSQVDQITRAGEIFSDVKLKLVQKQQELELRYRADPTNINPMSLSSEFMEYAKQLHVDAMALPDIQDKPFLKKYLATHLPNAVNSDIAQYMAQQNKEWQLWNRVKVNHVLDKMGEAAEHDPAMIGQMRALLDGTVLLHSYTAQEADAEFEKRRGNIFERRAINFARAHAEQWVDALKHGQRMEGFDETLYGHEALARIDREAIAQKERNQRAVEDQRVVDDRKLQVLQEKNGALLFAKYLDHMADPNSPPLTEGDISVLLEDNIPRLTRTTAQALYDTLRADREKAEVRVGENTYYELSRRVALSWDNPNKITKDEEIWAAATETKDGKIIRKLTVEQIKALLKDIEISKTGGGMGVLQQRNVFLESMQKRIDKSNPFQMVTDYRGQEQFGQFTRMVIATEQQFRDNKEDPSVLYDQTSPKYLGKLASNYETPWDDSMRHTLQQQKITSQNRPPMVAPPVPDAMLKKEQRPPRLPNESPQEYLDRIHKKP